LDVTEVIAAYLGKPLAADLHLSLRIASETVESPRRNGRPI